MAIVLSLIVAAVFGSGDFVGGLAAKKTAVVRVVAWSHLVGLGGVLISAIVIENDFIWRDVGLGAVGGACGGVGVALLYRGLARGPMSIVAPVTAVTSAAVPASWGVITGDRPGVWTWVGIAVAMLAIWLVSSTDDEPLDSAATPSAGFDGAALLGALGAGAGFGLFFIFIDAADEASAPWTIVGARMLTSTVLLFALAIGGRAAVPRGEGLGKLILATGVLDTLANVLFLYAVDTGDLTTVSVLTSLYPIATIALAAVVLGERIVVAQRVGAALAVAATILIALG